MKMHPKTIRGKENILIFLFLLSISPHTNHWLNQAGNQFKKGSWEVSFSWEEPGMALRTDRQMIYMVLIVRVREENNLRGVPKNTHVFHNIYF